MLLLALALVAAHGHVESSASSPQWIWTESQPDVAAAANQFTLFRTEFDAPAADAPSSQSGVLRLAVDSSASVFLNGVPIMRKPTRFKYDDLRVQVR